MMAFDREMAAASLRAASSAVALTTAGAKAFSTADGQPTAEIAVVAATALSSCVYSVSLASSVSQPMCAAAAAPHSVAHA